MTGFATLVMGFQFIPTARLALGQKVVFNSITYLLPNEFKQTQSSEVSSLTVQVKKGEIQLGFGRWSGAALRCESPPAFQDGWRHFRMHIPRGLHDLTHTHTPGAAGSTAHPTASTAAGGALACPPVSKAKEGLKHSGVIQSASLRLGFQREATWCFLVL